MLDRLGDADFEYASNEALLSLQKNFIARIDPAINTSDQLINSLYYSLWFPGWFGFNWDALYDCLRDLSWTGDARIYIIHKVVPNIEERNRRIYLEILRDSLLSWSGEDPGKLSVIFALEDRERIQAILGAGDLKSV